MSTAWKIVPVLAVVGGLLGSPRMMTAQGAAPAREASVRTTIPAAAYDTVALPTMWQVESAHANVQFTVRHMVGKVNGTFATTSGTLHTNGVNWTRGVADIAIQTGSLDTRNALRDKDLRSSRFFDVATFPTMTFTSTGMIHNGSSVELGGLLTIKGVTRPVTLRGEFLGSAKGTDGRRHMGFEAKTTIDRRPYGLTYNRLNDGFALVGNDATITILLEAVEVPRVPMK